MDTTYDDPRLVEAAALLIGVNDKIQLVAEQFEEIKVQYKRAIDLLDGCTIADPLRSLCELCSEMEQNRSNVGYKTLTGKIESFNARRICPKAGDPFDSTTAEAVAIIGSEQICVVEIPELRSKLDRAKVEKCIAAGWSFKGETLVKAIVQVTFTEESASADKKEEAYVFTDRD